MRRHQGAHPRVGALDVCPVVWPKRRGPRQRPRSRRRRRRRHRRPRPSRLPLRRARERRARGASAPTSAGAGTSALRERMRAGELEPDFGPGCAAPERRRDPGHRARPARRVQRRARHRRRRRRPRGRGASCASPAAGSRGVRAIGIDLERPRRRSRPTSTTRSRCRSAIVIEQVRALAAEHGARPVAAELVGLVPQAALRALPEDVPIRGFEARAGTYREPAGGRPVGLAAEGITL